MTEKKWLYAIIGAPLLIGLLVAIVCFVTGGPGMALKLGGGLLAGAIMVLGISRCLVWVTTNRGYRAFEQIGKYNGGRVDSNLAGEKQLRIPFDDYSILIEYRSTGPSDGVYRNWTRLALEFPAPRNWSRECWHIDQAGKVAGMFSSDRLKQAVGQLAIPNLEVSIEVGHHDSGSHIAISVPSYLQDRLAIEQLIELSTPRLEELALALDS